MIDARPAVEPRRTGVGEYARHLLRCLPESDPENSYVAWYAGGPSGRRRFQEGPANLSERVLRLPPELHRVVSWRLGLPRLEWSVKAFDLVVATNFLPPATALMRRAVLVVHDLAFLRFPETAPHVDGRWRARFARALQVSAGVIVPSASAERDLRDGFLVAAEKVRVVHHGVDAESFAPVGDDAVETVRARLGIAGPYALFLGGIEARKNLGALVRAFARVDGSPALVIAGGPVRWDPRAAELLDSTIAGLPAATRERIVRPGHVGDEDRRALLSGARLLAYPSLYEGFGFPVLEAFAAGVTAAAP